MNTDHSPGRRRLLQGVAALPALAACGQSAPARAARGGGAKRGPLRPADIRQLAFGLDIDHPEGVTTGPDGKLYAGGVKGQIYRIELDGTYAEIARTGGVSLGLALDADRAVYVCDPIKRAVHRIAPSGAVEVWCDQADGGPLVVPNGCAFGPDGSLWFTDSGHEDPDRAAGRLIRIPPGGGPAQVQPLPPLHFANGVCVDADGVVYVIEGFRRRLCAYSNGRLRTVVETPGFNPDGVALDRDGGFVIASYYPFALLTVKAGSGRAEVLFQDEWGITLKMPTNVSFFGDGLRELAISNLGWFAISATTPPVPGAPLFHPPGTARGPAASHGGTA